jgi:hypothetical protein
MEPLEEALQSLRLNPTQKISDVAGFYGVDRANLSKRFQGITSSREEGYDSQRVLNQGQAQALLHYIRRLTDKGYPPTHDMLRNFVWEITGIEVGKCWPNRFVQRFADNLAVGYLKPLDAARKAADSLESYKG